MIFLVWGTSTPSAGVVGPESRCARIALLILQGLSITFSFVYVLLSVALKALAPSLHFLPLSAMLLVYHSFPKFPMISRVTALNVSGRPFFPSLLCLVNFISCQEVRSSISSIKPDLACQSIVHCFSLGANITFNNYIPCCITLFDCNC